MPNPRLFRTPESALAAAAYAGQPKERHILARCTFPQTSTFCLAIVRLLPYELAYVEDQTPDICEAAIDAGASLVHLARQTPELCLRAVRRNAFALREAHFQTEEIRKAAVRNCGLALGDIPFLERSYDLCLDAVRQHPGAMPAVPTRHRDRELCAVAASHAEGWAWPFMPDALYDELIPKK